jgi:predicted  nucleic acid-binding Zn-ribbon protein
MTAAVNNRVTSLREREATAVDQVRRIDDKLIRLQNARRERAAALDKIRSDLARAQGAGSGVTESHGCRR